LWRGYFFVSGGSLSSAKEVGFLQLGPFSLSALVMARDRKRPARLEGTQLELAVSVCGALIWPGLAGCDVDSDCDWPHSHKRKLNTTRPSSQIRTLHNPHVIVPAFYLLPAFLN
jgi:hypothetical protein